MDKITFYRAVWRDSPTKLYWAEYLPTEEAKNDYSLEEYHYLVQKYQYYDEHVNFAPIDITRGSGPRETFDFFQAPPEDFVNYINSELNDATFQFMYHFMEQWFIARNLPIIYRLARIDAQNNETVIYYNENSVRPDWNTILPTLAS